MRLTKTQQRQVEQGRAWDYGRQVVPGPTWTPPATSIETTYKGFRFRSRLEARWAAMFDQLRWRWDYEPLDGNHYIPDFLIHGEAPCLVEVRPCVTRDDYLREARKVVAGLEGVWDGHVVLVGASPTSDGAQSDMWVPHTWLYAGFYVMGPANWYSAPSPIAWTRCGEDSCNRLAWFNTEDEYRSLPCGHWDGDHYLREVQASEIQVMWAAACNETRWTRSTSSAPADTPRPGWYAIELKDVEIGVNRRGAYWAWVFHRIQDLETERSYGGQVRWFTGFHVGDISKLKDTYRAFDAPLDVDGVDLIGEKVLGYIDYDDQGRLSVRALKAVTS